jgi:hypothetical protein
VKARHELEAAEFNQRVATEHIEFCRPKVPSSEDSRKRARED